MPLTITSSQNDEAPERPPLIIADMPQMAQFVFDFYKDRVDQLMSQYGMKVS